MTVYRFRAECMQDFIEFLKGSSKIIGFKKYLVTQDGHYPDIEVELDADMPLEGLRDELRKVIDGHVMVQTIARADDYTGERDYSL